VAGFASFPPLDDAPDTLNESMYEAQRRGVRTFQIAPTPLLSKEACAQPIEGAWKAAGVQESGVRQLIYLGDARRIAMFIANQSGAQRSPFGARLVALAQRQLERSVDGGNVAADSSATIAQRRDVAGPKNLRTKNSVDSHPASFRIGSLSQVRHLWKDPMEKDQKERSERLKNALADGGWYAACEAGHPFWSGAEHDAFDDAQADADAHDLARHGGTPTAVVLN
jgi:hypothetical protein